jgi:hypothetical protein
MRDIVLSMGVFACNQMNDLLEWKISDENVVAIPGNDEGSVLVQELGDLAYFQRRLKWRKKWLPVNRYVYKYRVLDPSDNTSKQRLEDLLVRSRLWLSSPDEFNDPFDSRLNLSTRDENPEVRFLRFMQVIEESSPQWSYEKKLFLALKYSKSPQTEIESIARNSFNKIRAGSGVYCFAADPRSILMWSHYANNHKGICIQIEPLQSPNPLLFAAAVDYIDEYPVQNWFHDQDRENVKKSVLAKFEDWMYEGEVRVVVPDGAHKFLSFDAHACTAVILGCAVEQQTIDLVKEIFGKRAAVGLPDVKLLSAERHSSAYRLVIRKFEH